VRTEEGGLDHSWGSPTHWEVGTTFKVGGPTGAGGHRRSASNVSAHDRFHRGEADRDRERGGDREGEGEGGWGGGGGVGGGARSSWGEPSPGEARGSPTWPRSSCKTPMASRLPLQIASAKGTVLYCTKVLWAAQYCTGLDCTALHCSALCCIVQGRKMGSGLFALAILYGRSRATQVSSSLVFGDAAVRCEPR